MSISTNNWLKKIFSVGSISLVVAIISLFVAYKTLLVDAGGELKIGFPAGDPANSVFEVEALTAEDIDSKLRAFPTPQNM